ncbi:MAG: class I SAM-dependent methyltransferase [Gaiellaceae bacterium MAG52_C11]|nr:class I SAM-dependent methyltransferase [Candidatus Gaiellasilicea maunaloa]
MEPTLFFPLLAPPAGCAACRDPRLRPLHLYPVNHNKPRVTPQLNLALYGCGRCGLAFSHPSPTEVELDAYYGSQGQGWDRRIATDAAKLARKVARKRISNRRDYGLLAANASLPGSTGRRALDFGCGIGAWLDVLAEDGWKTAGIEPGVTAAAAAGERHRILTEVPAEPTFELVVAHHVLEHLVDPLATLTRLAAATTLDGLIYLSVPNFARVADHLDIDYVASDKHISSFTPIAVECLFALAGFELLAHSNDPAWQELDPRPQALKRLVCIGRRTPRELGLRAEPLGEAIEALLAYGRIRPQPARPPDPTRRLRRLRRIARWLLR